MEDQEGCSVILSSIYFKEFYSWNLNNECLKIISIMIKPVNMPMKMGENPLTHRGGARGS